MVQPSRRDSPSGTITLVTVSKDGGDRLKRLLCWASKNVDEVNLFIDKTTTDGSREAAKSYGVEPKEIVVPGYVDAVLQKACDSVRTEWGIRLDDDELMGENFSRGVLPVTANGILTPRYNLCAVGLYMKDEWRYPDYQMRIFRRGYIRHSGELHAGVAVAGEAIVRNDLHIFHFPMLDYTREERERKWERYLRQGVFFRSVERGLAHDHYRRWSLLEDYPYTAERCEERCES